MNCSKIGTCVYGHNINFVCERCYRFYEGRLSRPCTLEDRYKNGKKIKTVLVDVNLMESEMERFKEHGKEEEFYKAFYKHIMESRHFKEEVRRFDA
ncbi:MAG: hypothetical protein ACRDD8_16190 [Bacteroidales bacterium]